MNVKNVLGALGIAAGVWAVSPSAHAVSFTITGGDPFALPASHDVLAPGTTGFRNTLVTSLTLEIDGPGKIRYEFVGFEAGATDTFTAFGAAGGTIFNKGGPQGAITGSQGAAGAVDFFYTAFALSATPVDINNGDMAKFRAPSGIVSFWISDPFGPNNNMVYIGLDDSGAQNDQDFDDLVIKATVSAVVAEPATLGVLSLGLVALGLMWRRRSGT